VLFSILMLAEESKERHAALIHEAEQIRRALRSKRVNRLPSLLRGLVTVLAAL